MLHEEPLSVVDLHMMNVPLAVSPVKTPTPTNQDDGHTYLATKANPLFLQKWSD